MKMLHKNWEWRQSNILTWSRIELQITYFPLKKCLILKVTQPFTLSMHMLECAPSSENQGFRQLKFINLPRKSLTKLLIQIKEILLPCWLSSMMSWTNPLNSWPSTRLLTSFTRFASRFKKTTKNTESWAMRICNPELFFVKLFAKY